MKEFLEKLNSWRILQLALIIGIVILAALNAEGWGWLVFILFLTL